MAVAVAFPAAGNRAPVSERFTGAVVPGSDVAVPATVNPFDPIGLNNLAVAEVSKGHYEQAHALLQRAARLAPARPDIALNLSNLERWMAQAESQAALGLNPKPIQAPVASEAIPTLPPLWAAPAQPLVPTSPARTIPVAPPGNAAPLVRPMRGI